MKTLRLIVMMTVIVLWASIASAVSLTVGNVYGVPGGTVNVPITVDNPVGIAGAAFTLQYDTSIFTSVTINSSFFDTFDKQWSSLPTPLTTPPQNNTGYSQPLVSNLITTGTTGQSLAAARCLAETDQTKKRLFMLTVAIGSGAVPGSTYTIKLVPTVLNNTAAGYAATGETISVLVGADPTKAVTDPAAFPVIVDKNYTGSTGGIQIKPAGTGIVNLDCPLGINLIPFTIANTTIKNASDLDAAIAAGNPGVAVSQIFGWNAQTQKFTAPYANLGGFVVGDFALTPGMSFFTETTGAPALSQFVGTDYTTLPVYKGFNLVTVPTSKAATVKTAAQFDTEIAGKTGLSVSQIFSWDAQTKKFTTPYANLGGFVVGDFNLNPGVGYFVELSGNGTYNP